MKRITSTNNPQFKRAVALHQRKYRKKYGQFILEGLRSVEELVNRGITAYTLWVSEDFLNKITPRGKAILTLSNGKVMLLPNSLFAELSDTQNSQGIIAVVDQPALPQYCPEHDGAKVLVLDGVQDPGNAGTLIRLAAAVGCSAVFATEGTVDFFNEKTVRSSMGAILSVPICADCSVKEIIKWGTDYGVPLVVTIVDGGEDYAQMKGMDKFLLVLGNEGRGINTELCKAAEHAYFIPLANRVESLNVATAAAVFLFHNDFLLRRQDG